MNKLWLNALTAGLILGAVSLSAGAQAGDRHDRDDWHDHREYSRGYDRDGWRGHDNYRRVAWREYTPVYYRPAPIYYRPVRYYPEPGYYSGPAYREQVRYDNDIHGSISVGF